jgi:GT2 family glycosyltransferase
VEEQNLPVFDLVVATVDRVEELQRLLASLRRQTYQGFRVVLVDQNEDDRLEPVLAAQPDLHVLRLRAARGLSHARNVALGHVTADVVGFPDDDCLYPERLLEDVARRFAASPDLDGLTGRAVDDAGQPHPSWRKDAARLTRFNLWNRAISYTVFLRRAVVEQVGAFDERLGLGSATAWSSGEEIDYLVRALETGARVDYVPGLSVVHARPAATGGTLRAIAYRDGASVGRIHRQHRYPARAVLRMLVRPLGGAVLALLRLDGSRAAVHLATLRGRTAGYRHS